MNAKERRRLQIIGNLSNYDMDIDEDDINGSECEDTEDYDREPEEYDYDDWCIDYGDRY